MYDTPVSKMKEVSHDASQAAQNDKTNSHKMGEGTTPTTGENSVQGKETMTPNANSNVQSGPEHESYRGS